MTSAWRRVGGGAHRGEPRERCARIRGLVVAGAEPANRRVELGGEHERRQDRGERSAALGEPHPAEDRDEGRAEHRDQLEHESGEERPAERRHRLLAVAGCGRAHL